MDSFFNLCADKQEHIINSAMTVFSRNGYKKASVADIAKESGISKSMVMYYFGSKKNLYIYLTELCGKLLVEEIEKGLDKNVTDFFDKIKMASNIKIAMIKQHPAIISFLTSTYNEKDEEVADNLEKFKSKGFYDRERILLEGTDVSKFKDDVDPRLLDKFFLWASEGFANDLLMNESTDKLNQFIKEFYTLLDLMKKYFYKE